MFSSKTPSTRFLLPRFGWTVLTLVFALGAGASALNQWLQTRMEVVTIHVEDVPLRVEVANNPVSRARGLKKRKMLTPDSGMLFVFPQPQILRFWMKDTPIDLDIGFFDCRGRLLNATAMTAFDDKTQHTSSGLAQYAVEVTRGWFSAHGLSKDALLVLPSKLDAR